MWRQELTGAGRSQRTSRTELTSRGWEARHRRLPQKEPTQPRAASLCNHEDEFCFNWSVLLCHSSLVDSTISSQECRRSCSWLLTAPLLSSRAPVAEALLLCSAYQVASEPPSQALPRPWLKLLQKHDSCHSISPPSTCDRRCSLSLWSRLDDTSDMRP